MYFGGIWAGQLQRWQKGGFDSSAEAARPSSKGNAISPRVARLAESMLQFAHEPREVTILGRGGRPIQASERTRRFFEAPWMHKHDGIYYL